jgi:hypothetical protein
VREQPAIEDVSLRLSAEASMRLFVSCVFVIRCFVPSMSAFQARATAARGKPAIHACSLLTKELIKKVTPLDAKELAVYYMAAPEAEEDTLGAGGSDCSSGGIAVQIDPTLFSFDSLKKDKDWEHAEPVAGVGDKALFHDNAGEWAEMVVQAGPHLLTIRMDTPNGKIPASIKPNVIALAKELLSKLK